MGYYGIDRLTFASLGIFISLFFGYGFWSMLTTPPYDFVNFHICGIILSVLALLYFVYYLIYCIKNNLPNKCIMNMDIKEALFPFFNKRNE